MDAEDQDRELAAAIEASLRSNTDGGREDNEDELLAMAIEQSRREEEARQRGEPIPTAAPMADPVRPPLISPHVDDDFGMAGSMGDEDVMGFGHHGLPADMAMHGIQGTHGGDEDMPDAQLAAAIEASYAAQTDHGREASEDSLIAQAIQMSRTEEETRQRAALREQQEQELQESMLMDQMRAEEEQRLKREEEDRRNREVQQKEADQAAVAADLEAKRGRVPPEPPAGEPGRITAQIRLPDGRRLRRAFRNSDTVGQVYDYADVEGGEALTPGKYRLVETMPRRVFEDREQTLRDAGLSGQCALLVELT